MTDLGKLGEKLLRIRLQLNLAEAEVERRTGIPSSDLKAFEQGRREPTGDQLLILSELYLVDYRFFLSNERKAPFEQTEILYRKYGEHLTTQDRWSIQEMLFFCENEYYLQGALGRAPRRFVLPKPKGTYLKGQGRSAAQQARDFLRLGEKEIPIDVFRTLRGLGIHLFRRPLANSNVSGLFLKHPEAGPCVLVNYEEDQYRQRFTVCHEVAHALLDSDEDGPGVSLKSEENDGREWRANSFAGAFLVPPGAIKDLDISSLSAESFEKLCHKLMVNAGTLLIAFKEFNKASASDLDRFRAIRIRKSDKNDPELGPDLTLASRDRRQRLLDRGLSYPYISLCFEGYREGKISLQRLAEMLLLSSGETIELLASFGEAVV